MQRGVRRVVLGATALAAVGLLVLARGQAQPIQEQRARLPPPASCTDPVVGTWLAHAYYPNVHQWGRITLRIQRTPGSATALGGTMHAQWWNGGPADVVPPTCAAGVVMFSVMENARGEITGQSLRFDAIDYRADQPSCGQLPPYLLDLFRGTIDPALSEFQAVLNADSPVWVNVPTVFRRIACGDHPSAPPPPPVLPPPPARSESGCSCL